MAEETVVAKEEEVKDAEEIVEEKPEVKKEEVKAEEKPQEEEVNEYTDDEIQALDNGWKPKDQWQGDPKKWVPADEYNRRGELFSKIDTMGRELRENKKALRMLQEHHGKVKEAEYNRALESLKAAKKQALIDGNADAVLEADEQLLDIKAARIADENTRKTVSKEPHPNFVAWVEKNNWYAQDEEMRMAADDIGIAHAKTHPEKSPEDVLKYVEFRIKKSYPEKFTNQNRNRPSTVAGREVQSGNKTIKDTFELTDEERKVMNTFVADGIMTKEQYIADLKTIKGVA